MVRRGYAENLKNGKERIRKCEIERENLRSVRSRRRRGKKRERGRSQCRRYQGREITKEEMETSRERVGFGERKCKKRENGDSKIERNRIQKRGG